MQPRYSVLASLVVLLALATMGVACSTGNQPSSVTWRNITLELPDDWYVFEDEPTRLSISNADIGTEAVRGSADPPDPDADVVAMFLTYEPRTIPADWRRYVEQQDATMESDEQILIGNEVPATRLVFSYVTDGTPLREMVVVVPSRGVVALAQPVPTLGRQDGPEVFLEHIDTFVEVLETADFGPPLMD